MKNCTPLWLETHVEVKMYKTHQVRTTARSTFRSQNVQNTPASEHFWTLRCRKSARPCGAKDISKSKCTTHLMFGPLLEVEMSKKCTPLWCEPHFEVKMYKAPQLPSTFRIELSKKCMPHISTFGRSDVVCLAGAWDSAPCQKS